MTTAAIAVDDWKLPTFEKRLTEAGYKYTKKKGTGVFDKCVFLNVESDNMPDLHELIKKTNAEATKERMN